MLKFILILIILTPITSFGQDYEELDNIKYSQTKGGTIIITDFLEIETSINSVPKFILRENSNRFLNSKYIAEIRDQNMDNPDLLPFISNLDKTYEINFLSLIEFRDVNQDRNLDFNIDKIESKINFSYQNWKLSKFNVQKHNISVTELEFNFTNERSNKIPFINFQNRLNSNSLNKLQLSLIIKDYSWLSSENRLALKINVTGGNLQQENQKIIWDKAFFLFNEYNKNDVKNRIKMIPFIVSENEFYMIFNYFNASLAIDFEIGIIQKGVLGYLIENEVPYYIGLLFFIVIYVLKREKFIKGELRRNELLIDSENREDN